ncbi:hypothetical protein CH333_10590 [candidate division WOR-3 bacterium JGI_Cruoil_03_44_89]|uniref:histidine kinase n=1 Tax=candidate division WOR-3 bacterium JGI_Cruoil_03_44_89 TaxID=1973748 RepID=A0A235BMX1_UNCW3|nr:MAG: hypothetical protein CH333_10590 [candidate division WOR-3 bacterium JGI_Cruoil_03_44_89]
MRDKEKTKEQLVNELVEMRRRINELKSSETRREGLEEVLEHRLIALTQPVGKVGELKLTDIIDLKILQELQDGFAEAHNVASIVFELDGVPITKPGNFSEFCRLIRSTPKGAQNCQKSDAELARECASGSPSIAHCAAFEKIMGGVVPIIVGGRHIANWGIGQGVTDKLDEDKVRQYAREIEVDEEKLVAASKELRVMPREQFERFVYFLDVMARHISLLGMQNLQQARCNTKRKHMKEALQRAKDKLEIEVEKRTSELRIANEQLRKEIRERKRAEEEKEKIRAQFYQAQKIEAIGRLAGGIAHNFNNLLTTIQGYADLSKRKVDENDPLYKYLSHIHGATVRGTDLTRQLLLFSRRHPMEFASLDINRTIEYLLKMLGSLISESITVYVDLQPDLWTVRGDKGSIEQVVMNLALNARDAMPEGGRLTIKTKNVTLKKKDSEIIPESRPGEFICLSVADTGVGMDEEIIQHIFEPFFSTKEAGKGIGLGLSTVKGIIGQHEGWINVCSEPGKGSIFEVYLPAVSTAAK